MKVVFTLICTLFFLNYSTAQCWQSVSAGTDHTLAIRTGGTLWVWGGNSFGQLGDGTITDRNNPLKIGVATDWQSISAGDGYSIAIKTDGTLWAWGSNGSGGVGRWHNYRKTCPC